MKKTGVSAEENIINSKMCSSRICEAEKMSSCESDDACGDGRFDVKSEH